MLLTPDVTLMPKYSSQASDIGNEQEKKPQVNAKFYANADRLTTQEQT